MQCPWQNFEPATLTFCERQLCAWIQTPANTWSNLAYLISGYFVCVLAYREHRPLLFPIGVVGIVVGIGSFIFHASGTFFGEVLDVSAMYLFISFAICMCVWRLKKLSPLALLFLYISLTAVSVTLLVTIKWVGITVFALYCSIAVLLEAYLHMFQGERAKYKYIWLLVLFFSAAYAVWWADISGVFCDPDNHFIQGHAIWHLLNSFCFYFLYRYYCQFFKGSEE